MDFDPKELLNRANEGDIDAQRDLAIRLYNGDGLPQDLVRANLYLKKAADGGDPWAQTTYAIQLRATKEPEKERESIEWLTRAVAQGDPRARCNLGAQQFLGIGTPVDRESAIVNYITASLTGYEDAREFLNKVKDEVPTDSWSKIFDRVRWPDLTFIMGPLADGHLDECTKDREQDDGTETAQWLEYERETAKSLFMAEKSSLAVAFDCAVQVKDLYVGRAMIEGHTFAAVTISMRNIVAPDGFPICSKPPTESLKALTDVIGLLGARKWVRSSYNTFFETPAVQA
jgi:Sel1 repeat